MASRELDGDGSHARGHLLSPCLGSLLFRRIFLKLNGRDRAMVRLMATKLAERGE